MKVGAKREHNMVLATFIFFALLVFYGVLLVTADERALAAAAEAAPAALQEAAQSAVPASSGADAKPPANSGADAKPPALTAAQAAGFELPAPIRPGEPVRGAAAEAAKATAPAVSGLKQTVAQVEKSLAEKAAHGFSTITIDKYGQQKEFSTSGKTVGEILRHLGISYEGRPIYPAPETPATNGMVVHILGKFEKLEVTDNQVPFTTRYIDDNKLPAGQSRVLQTGAPGKEKITYKYVLKDGYFQKIEIGRMQEVAPVEAVIERGPRNIIMTGQGAVTYRRKMVVESSAYTLAEGSGTGMTSLGIVPYEGIVAVDPDVIPYYTRMYIPGYGFAMAGDTGGAIIGNRIDLYMESYSSALMWGRRDVEIYIL